MGLGNPFNNPPGGLWTIRSSGSRCQTNIFPVTFDQNAPFSLNGPFLGLSNDMMSTNVHSLNATVDRQLGPRWFASAGYVGTRTNNIWESRPLNNALFIPVPGTGAAPTCNTKTPAAVPDDPINGQVYGPMDQYVTDGTQSYEGMLLSVRGSGS